MLLWISDTAPVQEWENWHNYISWVMTSGTDSGWLDWFPKLEPIQSLNHFERPKPKNLEILVWLFADLITVQNHLKVWRGYSRRNLNRPINKIKFSHTLRPESNFLVEIFLLIWLKVSGKLWHCGSVYGIRPLHSMNLALDDPESIPNIIINNEFKGMNDNFI